jgi:outer membrane protein assembly factor BamB
MRSTTTTMIRELAALSAIGLASLTGCGGASRAFSPYMNESSEDEVRAVIATIGHAAPRAAERNVAVGVTSGTPRQMFAWDLDSGSQLWTKPAEPQSSPIVAGDFVVTLEAGRVVVRALDSGNERFSFDATSLQIAGADAEGSNLVVSLSTGGGVGAASRILLFTNGEQRWVREVDQAFGAPAIRGEHVVIPWASQNVSVLQVSDGSEIARWQMRDEVVSRAFVDGDTLYLGQQGLYRVDERIVDGRRDGAAYLTTDVAALPGRPPFLRDAYAAPAPPRSALHSIRLAWRPRTDGAQLAFEGDSIYLVYYRLVFALDPSGETVRWVRSTTADVVGASVGPTGLLIAEDNGKISLLSANDGRPAWTADVGAPSSVIELRTRGFSRTGAPAEEPTPLPMQLMAAAQLTDARIVPARTFAVQRLAADPAPEVTENIIVLCETQTWPLPVRQAGCDALAERSAGGDYIIAALDRHAAFLSGTTPPPVGPLARAAAKMGERRAVPLLLAHLRDPATPAADLAGLVTALETLGDRSAAGPLTDFFKLYHAEEPNPALIEALTLSAHAIAALEGPVAEAVLREVADDPLGLAAVRDATAQVVASFHAHASAAEAADETTQREQTRSAERAASSHADARPVTLTSAHAEVALSGVRPQLQRCVREDATHPASVRIVISVDGDGHVQQVTTTPPSAQACIAPIVTAQPFPATRDGRRQQLTYVVRY